jgi:hypothetical protein
MSAHPFAATAIAFILVVCIFWLAGSFVTIVFLERLGKGFWQQTMRNRRSVKLARFLDDHTHMLSKQTATLEERQMLEACVIIWAEEQHILLVRPEDILAMPWLSRKLRQYRRQRVILLQEHFSFFLHGRFYFTKKSDAVLFKVQFL